MSDTSYLQHQHHQCAWCKRLIHRDSRLAHGPAFGNLAYLIHHDLDRGYSHGACLICKNRLLAPKRAGYGVMSAA